MNDVYPVGSKTNYEESRANAPLKICSFKHNVTVLIKTNKTRLKSSPNGFHQIKTNRYVTVD